MDWAHFYLSPEWAALREDALRRDADRCTVARLLGGPCSPTLHVHHLSRKPEHALDLDWVGTTCSAHHPQWEAVRRSVTRVRDVGPCGHHHRYDHAREECRRRRAVA